MRSLRNPLWIVYLCLTDIFSSRLRKSAHLPVNTIHVFLPIHSKLKEVYHYSSFAPLLGGFGGKKSIRMAKKMVKGTRICGI